MTLKDELWFAIVEQEESELMAVSLVEEILQRTQNVLFEKHIENQLLPYAVEFAKDQLLQSVQVGFRQD
jgi:hypothetical protein